MGLANISKHMLINMELIMGSIIRGDLKRAKEVDRDIWSISIIMMMVGMYTWGSFKTVKEKVMENR